jgi:hypothetical protein
MQVYSDFNKELLTYVQTSIKAGKTSDQATADYRMPEKFTSLGYQAPPAQPGGRGGPGNVIRTGYTELGGTLSPQPAAPQRGGARGQ